VLSSRALRNAIMRQVALKLPWQLPLMHLMLLVVMQWVVNPSCQL
jgi:hypothetical protein